MTLQQVLDGDLCSGCGLCASIMGPDRAEMALLPPGYLRPVMHEKPTPAEESILAQACPGVRVAMPAESDQMTTDWGPVNAVFTGYAKDGILRHRASSGGMISALLQTLLDQPQGPRFVVHIGADPNIPWLNAVGESRSAADILGRAGSRYAPSAPLLGLLGHLERGEKFVVVGKPCDIAALRAYGKHDARVNACVSAMISFMCGGIPSETGIRMLLRRIGAPPDEVTHFRYRGNGWPGEATALLGSGEARSISYAQSWGEVLSKHMQLRCKICADGSGMSADIVCADAWYGDERGYPLFNEQEGRSLILVRNVRGQTILDLAIGRGAVAVENTSINNVLAMQPFQARRTRLTLSRLLAMRLVGRSVPDYAGMRLIRSAIRAGFKANLRSFLGTLYRGLRGRL
jgi:coenzyme F420 hydrogenase subunit beta